MPLRRMFSAGSRPKTSPNLLDLGSECSDFDFHALLSLLPLIPFSKHQKHLLIWLGPNARLDPQTRHVERLGSTQCNKCPGNLITIRRISSSSSAKTCASMVAT